MVTDQTGSDEDEEESEEEDKEENGQEQEQEQEQDEQEGEERGVVDAMLDDADEEIGDLQEAIAQIPVQSKRMAVEQERDDEEDEQEQVSFLSSDVLSLTFSTAAHS